MPQPRLDTENARKALQAFRFDDLFIEVLNWNNPSRRSLLTLADEDGAQWQVREISELGGLRVYEVCPLDPSTPLPNAKNQQVIWQGLRAQSVENIAIFVDAARTQSLWYWMKRDGQRTLPRRHTYIKGQPGDLFLSKLAALVVDLAELNDQGDVSITVAAERVRSALDVETVTKVFFQEFKQVHDEFLTLIEGIVDENERRWYASVLLNRLMFIWFLQKKLFLDGGDADYLRRKFDASIQGGKGDFFSHFLRDLFFEGFAKPADKRHLVGDVPLGDIPYLNGGLFLPHGIEARIEGETLFKGSFVHIRIPDTAFGKVFALFQAYSWNLDDTPGGQANEINPDVLGYIFEKYINQKEFGAYYTRPEITEYLCEQTIHQLVLDAAAKHFDARRASAQLGGLKLPVPERNFDNLGDVFLHADGSLCQLLLTEILPRLSLLDPACGSGAFLVASLKTMLSIYTGLLGRAEAIGEERVLRWREQEQSRHKSPFTYWLKKKIITENLFGVDIMEEAVEIAKLRLFLTLVASATKRDELEPLPNIEFNLLPGNSLIGLLHVDPAKFDAGNGRKAGSGVGGDQGRMDLVHEAGSTELGMTVESKVAPTAREKVSAHLAVKRAQKYDELLREKNRLVDLYKKSALDFEDLSALKNSIEAKKNEARTILNKLLLDEFIGLGIQFEQATWDEQKGKEGKPQKRKLRIADIQALHPFHWAYEFDEIIVIRGGFDAVITNPPWEAFKPQAKEFFNDYSELVMVNNMTIKDFETEQARILTNPTVQKAWIDYLSRFPHLAAWFRGAKQFSNQQSTVEGKKVGSDINLYKLFVEQCLHILNARSHCGMIVPTGIYTDLGTKQLRQTLFAETDVHSIFGLANEKFLFEGVDHRFKFCVLSFRKGNTTSSFTAAFRITPREAVRSADLDTLFHNKDWQIQISVRDVERFSPDSLSIIEFRGKEDYDIVTKAARLPRLGELLPETWNVRLQSEFHMTNDSYLFHSKYFEGARPLVEGKMVHQFTSTFSKPRYWLDEAVTRKALLGRTDDLGQTMDYQAYRMGVRKIARSSDERTLIAAFLPPSFHSESFQTVRVFDHKGERTVGNAVLLYLCAVWNTFTVDSLLRLRVSANVNFFYVYQLPIPRLDGHDPAFRPLVERAARLVGTNAEFDNLLKEIFGPDATHQTHGVTDEAERLNLRAEIDARVAQLYDLTEEELTHILSTFPLVKKDVKTRTLGTFRALLPSADAAAVAQLIAGGETDKVEFKEGAAYSRQIGRKQPEMLTKVLREVAAFLNTSGGSVLVGVDDDGKVVGLTDDFPAANERKPNPDGYGLFLREAMSNRLDPVQTIGCTVTFHRVNDQDVCRILVPASPKPVYLDGELLIRAGTTSRSLRPQDATSYVFQHWGTLS